MQAALSQQRKELEAVTARHLQFIDRLLADKDRLAAKCTQMAADGQVSACSGQTFLHTEAPNLPFECNWLPGDLANLHQWQEQLRQAAEVKQATGAGSERIIWCLQHTLVPAGE